MLSKASYGKRNAMAAHPCGYWFPKRRKRWWTIRDSALGCISKFGCPRLCKGEDSIPNVLPHEGEEFPTSFYPFLFLFNIQRRPCLDNWSFRFGKGASHWLGQLNVQTLAHGRGPVLAVTE